MDLFYFALFFYLLLFFNIACFYKTVIQNTTALMSFCNNNYFMIKVRMLLPVPYFIYFKYSCYFLLVQCYDMLFRYDFEEAETR